MPQIALPTDWKTVPMPEEADSLPFQRIFSAEEFECIRIGLIPQQMEDRWFIYYDNHTLNFHRSWTGFHVYQITFQQLEDNRYAVTHTRINRSKEQNKHPNNDYDVSLLNRLIDRLLLEKSDPTPNITENEKITTGDRLCGFLMGGAIGDALGSFYEGQSAREIINWDLVHGITDDTQLTLATCESIIESGQVSAASIAQHLLAWFNSGKLTGLGASTLKALRDLQAGAHWALSGRTGEYAAGNGAAMRIAPLAFFTNPETDRTLIRDVCSITHKNDEAYVGALAILYALHFIITEKWIPGSNLIELITPQLPDSGVRDNLLKLQSEPFLTIRQANVLVGTSGHVIDSIPFSIFASSKIRESSFEEILTKIILCGGDTDTNASLAGQIMGAYIGLSQFSPQVSGMFTKIKECAYMLEIANKLSAMVMK